MTDIAPRPDDPETSAESDADPTDELETAVEQNGAEANSAEANSAEANSAAPDELGAHRTLRADVWRQFRRHRGAVFGLIVLTIIVLAVFVGSFLRPYDATQLQPEVRNQGFSWDHPAGTDQLGRDFLAQALQGGRISLSVGFAAMVFGNLIGVFIGLFAGFVRWLDGPLMRFTDVFLALPILPLLLVCTLFFREPMTNTFGDNLGIFILVVVIIGATSWMSVARIVRSDVLGIREEEFVIAARSVGTRTSGILSRHVLPNVMSSIIVASALGVAAAILTESAISFLGLGFPQDLPTWGKLLSDGNDYMQINIWRTIVPGAFISLTVLSVNFIGDGLRDALDPRLRSKG
ncbi:MAG: ABC transporter permease [Actinomycetota bacterium]